MISCRWFTRINRASWNVGSAYLTSTHSQHFNQGCNAYHVLSSSIMDPNKKQKTSKPKPVWRPVSTHSGSVAKNVKVQSDSSFVEVKSEEKSEAGVQVHLVQEVQDTSNNGGMASAVSKLSISSVAQLKEGGDTSSADTKADSVQLLNATEIYSVSVEISASLMRFIKGKGGSTHKQIEEETGTKIIFPSSKKENSVVIKGVSVKDVNKASEKIKVILEEAVKSPNLDYSHFISLPLAIHPGLVEKLMDFQNSILGTSNSEKAENESSESDGDISDETEHNGQQIDGGHTVAVKLKTEDENEQVKVETKNIPVVSYPPKASKSSHLSDLGIDKSIFIKPKTFHLTVLMLKLWNNDRVTAAMEILQSVSSKVMDALEGKPVFVRLKGLESMRGSLAKARVLYTPVEVFDGEERLLRACQVITDAYVEAGLVLEKDAHQKLKLHGTVMNARHRKREKRTKRSDSFDARSIVERYGSEDWGVYLIPEIHLSQRFVFDESGYYHCCASIPLPDNKLVE